MKNPSAPGVTTFPSRIGVIGTLPRSSRVLSDRTHPASRKYLFSTHDHGWLRSSWQASRGPDCTSSRLFALVAEEDDRCEGCGDVVGVVTPLVGGEAQAFHDDRVVELRAQLGVQEVEGKEDREEQVEVERERRVKEVRP